MTTMQFILDGRDRLSDALNRAGDSAIRLNRRLDDTEDHGAKALEGLKKSALSLAPAIIPAAAAMAPLVASTAAAGVAVAAYGAALGPQIAAMAEASQAEKKYNDAVDKSGKSSKEAVQAHEEYRQAVAKLPPATRTAAAALSVLKDQYKSWSDGLAKDTMGPVVKGMAIAGALFPKLTPLVKGTSTELNRMMTLLAGGMQSPGFDRLIKQFSEFSTGVLKRANDGIVHLVRSLDTGKVGGGLSEFMAYARANGPVLGDVLRNVGQALLNVVRAGADVGVGMLQAVNVLSKLVAAVPPSVITALLQLSVAIKVARLAMLGLAASRAAVAAFGAQLLAMRTAAGAAGGGLASFTAAIGAMSRGAKVAMAGTAIGLLVIAISELSNIGKRAPTDMDRMTTSLGTFARSGKLSGEAAKVLGSNFKEFDAALRGMARPGQLDQIQQGITSFFGMDSTPVKRWKATLDDVDKSLANMVKGGNAQLAAQAFDQLAARARSQGLTTGELRKQLGDYRAALADQAFEQQLAAQSMGLFGAQAQATSAKLAAQKQSADGLAQSINALNNVYLQARGGIRGMEAAIDAADEAFKQNGKTLDENTAKGRGNNQALDDIAAATMKAAEGARENGASWATVNGIYDRGREKIVRLTAGVTGNEQAARRLAAQILKTPNKTAMLKGDITDLKAKIQSAETRLKNAPLSKQAKIRAELAALRADLSRAQGAINALHGTTITSHHYLTTHYDKIETFRAAHGKAQGGIVGFPGGGPVSGPGTSTSDSILTRLSNGEYVVKAQSVARYGIAFMDALNQGRLSMAAAFGSGTGGSMAGAGAEVGRGLSAGMRASAGGVEASARAMAAAVETGVRAELEIASPSKKMKALAADTAKGMIIGLTGSKAKIAAVAKDLVKDIWAAWAGTKSGKDSSLVRMVNRDTVKLQRLAHQRDTLGVKILEARKFANDLAASTRQGAELGNLGLQPEEVSTGSIIGGLAGKLGQIRTFTRAVAQLAKKGLNKGLLRQILNMGPDAGYAYANALAAADKGTLAQVNALQGQLDKAASTLGYAGADALYDSGKNAGKGFLAGLISQQKAIEAQMLKIAVAMQKAIKRALGIKSPSQVMARLGRYSTQGLAVGLVHGIPHLDKALGTVTGRVAAARPAIGLPAAAGVGSGSMAQTVIHNEFHINGAIDPTSVGRQIETVLAKYQRDNGGAVLNFKTKT